MQSLAFHPGDEIVWETCSPLCSGRSAWWKGLYRFVIGGRGQQGKGLVPLRDKSVRFDSPNQSVRCLFLFMVSTIVRRWAKPLRVIHYHHLR